MKKIGELFQTIGIILLFTLPIYQYSDMLIKCKNFDTTQEFGNNMIFKNIIGVKTVHYLVEPGQESFHFGTDIETPSWMQKYFSLDNEIHFGYPYDLSRQEELYSCNQKYYVSEYYSPDDQICKVIALRWIIKLLIPGIFIIIGYFLKNKYL